MRHAVQLPIERFEAFHLVKDRDDQREIHIRYGTPDRRTGECCSTCLHVAVARAEVEHFGMPIRMCRRTVPYPLGGIETMLVVSDQVQVPLKELSFSFARS